MAVETLPWNIQDHLKSAERQAGYLQAALEEGDPTLIAAVLSDIAKARGMSAEEVGFPKSPPQDAIASSDGPLFSNVARAMKALGLRFAVTVDPRPAEPA